MDPSKAFGCLSREPILAKLHACRVDMKSLKLLQDYLSDRTQRVKLDFTFSSWLKSLQDVTRFVEKTDICNLLMTTPYRAVPNQQRMLLRIFNLTRR